MGQLVAPLSNHLARFRILQICYPIINAFVINQFVYAIAAILGAMVVVVGIDAHIFFSKVFSQR
jgi:hypothetical protein